MSEGEGLFGQPAAAPRGKGRPKGSKNKRTKDLKGFIDGRYGASAAQQLAALAMVTPAELRAAGGSMAKAVVNKALDLVRHVREAQQGRDEWLRQVVREELETLAASMPGASAKDLRQLVGRFLGQVREASAGFGMKEALAMLAQARGELLPYTDQRQPQAVEMVGDRAPSVVIMGAGPVADMVDLGHVEKVEDFQGFEGEVAQPKSHAESEAPEIAGLICPPAAD